MSDTPETDAQSYDYKGKTYLFGNHVPSYFARNLERQRNMLLVALEASRIEHLEVREILINRIAEGESLFNWLGQTKDAIEVIEKAIASVRQESPCVGKES